MTNDEMIDSYPGLNEEKFEAASAYFRVHRQEILDILEAESDFADSVDLERNTVLVRLRRKTDAPDDPVLPG